MMKLNKLVLIPLFAGALGLTGCSNESAKQVDVNLNYVSDGSTPAAGNANAQAQLAQASSSASKSLQELSAIQMSKNPRARLPQEQTAGGLSRQASLSWNGPVQQAVARVASAAGYKMRVIGSAPATPVLININARNQRLGTILRNIQLQAEPAATVRAYPSSRVIELRYNKR